MYTGIRSVFIVLAIVIFFSHPMLAITNEEVFSQFQFNFITPGARAISMGGAFTGLVDDATAVESNPAGLTSLVTPEISAEYQYLSYAVNRAYGYLDLQAIPIDETSSVLTNREFENSVISPTFISVIYPYNRFVFSFYRQELVHYESSYQTSPYRIMLPITNGMALTPTDASVDLMITNYGVGIAIEFLENFSIAVSPRWSIMKMKSIMKRYVSRFHVDLSRLEDLYFPPDFESTINDENNGFSLNTGIVWGVHPKFSIGIVHKMGARFNVAENCSLNQFVNSYTPPISTVYKNDITLKVPDSLGIGAVFRANKFLTFTLDLIYVKYKDLLENFIIDQTYLSERYIRIPTDRFYRDLFEWIDLDKINLSKENYTINNVTEIHFGMEYILELGERFPGIFLAMRSGVYYEPDHTIHFTGTTGDPGVDAYERELFPPGKDRIHITGGLGLVINNHFQIDTAANIDKKNKQLSISVVYRF